MNNDSNCVAYGEHEALLNDGELPSLYTRETRAWVYTTLLTREHREPRRQCGGQLSLTRSDRSLSRERAADVKCHLQPILEPALRGP